MTAKQWFVTALVLVGFSLLVYWQDQRDLSARADVLRQFFGLPTETEFADIRVISKSSVRAPRVEAVVRFTEQQFEDFADNLDSSGIWRQAAPWYDGAPVEADPAENLRWRDPPVPAHAGDRPVSWTRLSAADVAKLQRGRVLCIALQRKPGSDRNEHAVRQAPRFAAKDCSQLAPTEAVATLVLGALDFDTRTLHMVID